MSFWDRAFLTLVAQLLNLVLFFSFYLMFHLLFGVPVVWAVGVSAVLAATDIGD